MVDLGRRVGRLDFHAANGIGGGLQILRRLGLEFRRAVLAAEVVGLAAVRDGGARLRRIHGHPANRIDNAHRTRILPYMPSSK